MPTLPYYTILLWNISTIIVKHNNGLPFASILYNDIISMSRRTLSKKQVRQLLSCDCTILKYKQVLRNKQAAYQRSPVGVL